MFDKLDFFGGVLLGTLVGSLATLVYFVRQIHHEARQNYVQLSLAQAEVATLERTLELYRCKSDLVQQTQNPAVPEDKALNALPLPLTSRGNCEDPAVATLTSAPVSSRSEKGYFLTDWQQGHPSNS